jgi:predicted nucleic acid-binding protein
MSSIINNTVIVNLALIDRFDLLKENLGTAYITPEVLEEIEEGINQGYAFMSRAKDIVEYYDWLLVTGLKQEEDKTFRQLAQIMGRGEASCISVAMERKWSFFTDDDRARRFCINNKIRLGGTFGILLMSIDKHIITEYKANELLQIMIKFGYRSPYSDIKSYYERLKSK